MYSKKVYILLIALLSISASSFSQSKLKKEIEKIIHYDTEIELKKTPGFLIHIIDGEDQYIEHFGSREKGSKDTLTCQDKFQLGSVTKIFTSALTLEMAKREIIQLDDPIHSYLDPSITNESLKHLTIRDLLLHVSNFPKRPNNFGKKEKRITDPYAYYTKEDLQEFYLNYKHKEKKDAKRIASYSHINYALLEVILEQASQTSFEDLMKTYVLEPSQMNSSGITIDTDTLLTPGYRKTSKESNAWTFASFSGSEGMYSSAHDLSSFLSSYLNDEAFPLQASVATSLSENIPTKYNDSFYSAMGWQVIKDKTPYDICAMAGTTDGHNAFIAMVQETKTAVIVLSNSAIGTEDLGMQVLRMINNNWDRKGANEQE